MLRTPASRALTSPSRARAAENTTSAAVKPSPPWNRTPWRRWKRQARRLDHLPRLGKGRLDGEIDAPSRQALVDVAEKAQGEGHVERVRVERSDVALVGPGQGALIRIGGRNRRQGRSAAPEGRRGASTIPDYLYNYYRISIFGRNKRNRPLAKVVPAGRRVDCRRPGGPGAKYAQRVISLTE